MNKLFFLPTGNWLALAALTSLSLSSCAASKNSTTTLKKDSPEFIAHKVESQRLHASWFEGKVRIDYSDNTQSFHVNATIRMKADSAVWIAVRKLGFEVARAFITKDSVLLIDRFNNEFMAYDLEYLQTKYQLPANLAVLQDLILGNSLKIPFLSRTMSREGNDFWLEEHASQHQLRQRINGDTYTLETLEYQDLQRDKKMIVRQTDFAPAAKKHIFSYLRQMQLETEETGLLNVELKYSEVELNVPKDMAFDVPERYRRAQ